ncbi:MAG: hypothetical protein ACHBNF_07820 [Chromatiales bacterium]
MPILTIKRLTLCSLTALMCTGGPAAFAHTLVQDAATAGTESFNAFVITHGCGGGHDDPTPLKVRGQSAVFPFGAAVWNEIQTDGVEVPIPTGAVGITNEDEDFITLDVGGIQDNDPFKIQQEETNPLGNDPPGPFDSVPVRALNWKGGALSLDLLGTPKFQVTPPTILDPCVSVLHVRIAVANWCEKHKNEANDADNDRADWWFTGPDKTGSTLFVDPELVQEDFWTTLTVINPDAASCTGTPREVAVQPSGTDIDTYLPYKPFTKGPGPY